MTLPVFAVIISCIGLLIIMAVHTVGVAFMLGKLSQRVKQLEDRPNTNANDVALARIEEKVTSFNGLLVDLKEQVNARFITLEEFMRTQLQTRDNSRRRTDGNSR